MQESGDDQDDQRRAEKAPGANKGHWKFRSFTKGPNSAFGDTKDTERLRKKKTSTLKNKTIELGAGGME